MKPRFVQKKEITLVGLSFYGDPFETSPGWTEENQIGRLWQRLMAYFEENNQAITQCAQADASYEVHIYGPETITKGLFEFFVGFNVIRLGSVPLDLLVKKLPPAEYALFTLEGTQISSDWHMEVEQWITSAGYQRSLPFSIQYYDERFKGVDQIEESVLDVLIPVVPAA